MMTFALPRIPSQRRCAFLNQAWGRPRVSQSPARAPRGALRVGVQAALLAGWVAWLAFPAGASPAAPELTYGLNFLATNYPPYYVQISGLPLSGRLAINPLGGSAIGTDGAGRISGVELVEIPAIGGTFTCNVSGLVSRIDVATTVRMLIQGEGIAVDENSNPAPAAFTLTFNAAPLEFAAQSTPVVTVATNVALISSDGSTDGSGDLIWVTNLTDYLIVPPGTPQTNVLSAITFTNLLAADGTLIPLAVVSTNYATNVVSGTPGVSSFSFTNDWAVLQGTLKGSLRVGGKTTPFNDTKATLAQPHLTNWQGAPLVAGGTFYATVYSLFVGGNLNLAILDSFNATIIQSGRNLYALTTNLAGKGIVKVNSGKAPVTSSLTLVGAGAATGSLLKMTATNGTLITSYAVNSNAPPVVVTFTNSIGAPPIFSVSNSVSWILTLDDVVNFVTNGAWVIESHYGPADLTNPAYITNTISGAIKAVTLSGRVSGQAFSGVSGVNLDAQDQLLPVGTEPSGSFSP